MGAVPVRGVRLDLGGCELLRERLDLALLRRQLEVHGRQTTRMRLVAILLGLLALTACGSKKTASPSEVVRAWSAALDRNDNEQAARLFADGAQIIQNGEETLLTHADAVRWNAGLPCGGRISHLELHG